MTKKKEPERYYTPTHLANYFIENLDYVDNIRLNKFVYLAFGIAYAYYNRILFKEPIQAWRLGPVIPSIYHEFKKYGYGKITESSYIHNPVKDKMTKPVVEKNDEQAIATLQVVKEEYSSMSTRELIDRIHDTGTPWKQFYKEGKTNIEIDIKTIKQYFKKEILVA